MGKKFLFSLPAFLLLFVGVAVFPSSVSAACGDKPLAPKALSTTDISATGGTANWQGMPDRNWQCTQASQYYYRLYLAKWRKNDNKVVSIYAKVPGALGDKDTVYSSAFGNLLPATSYRWKVDACYVYKTRTKCGLASLIQTFRTLPL